MKLYVYLILVCCALQLDALSLNKSKSDVLPTKNYCGFQHADNYYSAEKGIKTDEFPWVVFLPLKSRVNNPGADIRCSGALISKRYVIISKSCLQFVVTKIHLGQHDTFKNTTCNSYGCEPVLELGFEEKVIDENKDVVLLRLERDVEFSDNIRPICLPFDEFAKPEPGATLYSSGWGLKSSEEPASKIKKKVKHALVSNEDCHKNGILQNANDKNAICVQVQEDSPDKPCSGDEGSPIMYSHRSRWILEGVLTAVFDIAGNLPCSVKTPVRGAKITDEVLEWIVDNVHG